MKVKICVSGAAVTTYCKETALELAKEIGREIVRQNGVLITGATTGIPYWAAIGAKEEGGVSIGFSPATSRKEHIKTFRLPTDYFDVIVYTGFNYAGRNLLMTRASDGVIIICGRMGTLNEFTIAFEDRKPIGVLVGSGGTADMIEEIVKSGHKRLGKIVYNNNPKELVRKLTNLIQKEKELF